MLNEFRQFLLKTNALALAIGVIIGAAVGKVVSSIVADLLMPVIGLVIPGGEWRQIKIPLSYTPDGKPANSIMLGSFLGNLVDFIIVALVVFLITRALLKPAPVPPSKTCGQCLETVNAGAVKCKFCGSAV